MDKEKAKEISARAKEAFSKKDFPTAIKEYTEAIACDPTDHIFFSNRSACYASLEQYEDALDDAKKCIELKPDFIRGYSRKGLAEFYLKKYPEAKETYEQGLKIDPNNEQLKEGLGRAEECMRGPQGDSGPGNMFGSQQEILQKLLNDPETKEYFKDPSFISKLQMCQTNPQFLMSLMNTDPRFMKVFQVITGISMDDLKKASAGAGAGAGPSEGEVPEEAPSQETYQEPPKPKEKAPEPPKAPPEPETPEQAAKRESEEFKVKGNKAYKEKKFEEALELYDKAIALNAKEPIFNLNKASVYLSMQKYDDCLKCCDEAVKVAEEISPKPFDKIAKAYARKGNCYTQMKEWDKGIEMYDKALLESNDHAIREAKRNCEKQKKDFEAQEYLDPAKGEEAKEKGNQLYRDGNFVAAIKEYDESIKRNPKIASVYLNRAMSLMKILDYNKALTDINKALELDPQYAKAYGKRGNIHYFLKEYHKAIEDFDNGLKIDPTNTECLEGRQKTQQAIYQSPPDQERARKAMDDPEIRALLQDPRIAQVLNDAKENPASINAAMRDPFISQAIQKLIAAGVLGVK